MAFITIGVSYGQDGDLFRPFREGASNHVDNKDVEKARKKLGESEKIILEEAELILSKLQDDLTEASYENLILSLEEVYSKEFGKKAQTHTQKKNLHLMTMTLLRGHRLIDDIFFRLINDYIKNLYPTQKQKGKTRPAALTLSEYLLKKSNLRKLFKRFTKIEDETVPHNALNPFPLKDFKFTINGKTGLSAQERLFYLYTPVQIREMGNILDFALNVADAARVFTTIEFRDSEEALVLMHSPTEQYRLALRLMRMKKEEAENNPSQIGVPIKDIDLIVAAYTLGILSYDELALIVGNPDFYLPKVSFVKKVVKYLTDLTLLAVRVHPATAPYALVPMILYNSYAETKKIQDMVDEDSFVFSLPERRR